MSYTPAIFDRILSDVTTPTAKGYMNVLDWNRIYGNAQLVNSLVAVLLPASIDFVPVVAPTIFKIAGTYAMFSRLLSNIESIRLAVSGLSIPHTSTEIISDIQTFDYSDVNLWERTLDEIWKYYEGDTYEVCPTLTADLIVLTGETKIIIDCLDTATFDVDLQGSGHLVII
jgi:hypothetical protein